MHAPKAAMFPPVSKKGDNYSPVPRFIISQQGTQSLGSSKLHLAYLCASTSETNELVGMMEVSELLGRPIHDVRGHHRYPVSFP